MQVKEIVQMSHQLPFYSQRGVHFSSPDAACFFKQHVLPSNGLTSQAAGILAAARLERLMHGTRHQLSDRFEGREILALLDCFQADIFWPDEIDMMASCLCFEHGIEPDELEAGSSLETLAHKLAALTPLERVTLADALEQAWYRAGEGGKTHLDVFAEVGIKLR